MTPLLHWLGRNGSGKSSFLSAIELFYDPYAKVTVEDFYSEDTTQDIEIEITFANLSAGAKKLFSAYINNDVLTVVRVFSLVEGRRSGTYHGVRLQNPDFSPVRNAGRASDVIAKYREIRETEEYSSLPTARSEKVVRTALNGWERQHPARCSRMRDDGQFFGFTQVGKGHLGKHTKFIRVPAVRDAQEDATEKKGSAATEIMDLVVRSAFSGRKDLANFKQQTQAQYKELMDPEKLPEMDALQRGLSDTLRSYAPGTSVRMQWSEIADISLPMPQVQVKLLEDDYESAVGRTGHGLQRAFIVTMLQHLHAAREAEAMEGEAHNAGESHLPGLVLAIEEPELYQHPSRQRHLASVLREIATGKIPGVAQNTQVIYTTHSPLFVGLDRFPQIRVLRKIPHQQGSAKVTRLKEANMDVVAEQLWEASVSQGEQYTAENTTTPVSRL